MVWYACLPTATTTGPGLIPGPSIVCRLSLLLVLALALRVFFRFSGFRSAKKQHSKSKFDLNANLCYR